MILRDCSAKTAKYTTDFFFVKNKMIKCPEIQLEYCNVRQTK